jgi:ribonucleoside-diphosphate reductase alpha chain
VNTSPIDSITQKEEEIEFDEEEIYSERIIEEVITKPSKVKTTTAPIKSSIKITATPVKKNEKDRIKEAKLKGYTGDICQNCGQATMVRNGTCLKCMTCAETSGCS